MCGSVFDKLIWCTIDPHLAQRAFYLAQNSSPFGPDGTVNYDYIIVTNSIKSLLIESKCIPNGAHITIVEPIWPVLQKLSKTLM